MKSPNLIPSALFSVTLIGAFAWLGEITHGTPQVSLRTILVDTLDQQQRLTEDPDKAADDEVPDEQRRVSTPAPDIQDAITREPPTDAFRQQVEPPPPVGDTRALSLIPQFRSNDVAAGGALDLSQLDQPPVIRFQARPDYPYEMRRDMVSGEVLVDFIVDAHGNVRNAFAASSSRRDFEAAAEKAVSQWKFRPGRRGGHAVAVHMQIPIVFSIADGS